MPAMRFSGAITLAVLLFAAILAADSSDGAELTGHKNKKSPPPPSPPPPSPPAKSAAAAAASSGSGLVPSSSPPPAISKFAKFDIISQQTILGLKVLETELKAYWATWLTSLYTPTHASPAPTPAAAPASSAAATATVGSQSKTHRLSHSAGTSPNPSATTAGPSGVSAGGASSSGHGATAGRRMLK